MHNLELGQEVEGVTNSFDDLFDALVVVLLEDSVDKGIVADRVDALASEELALDLVHELGKRFSTEFKDEPEVPLVLLRAEHLADVLAALVTFEVSSEVAASVEESAVALEFFVASFKRSRLALRKLLGSHFLPRLQMLVEPNQGAASPPQKLDTLVAFGRPFLSVDLNFLVSRSDIWLFLSCSRDGWCLVG